MAMDLDPRGRVSVESAHVTVTGNSLTGDEVLNDLLARMVHRAPQSLSAWIGQLAPGGRYRVGLARRLVAAGVLRAEDHCFLRVVPCSRFPEVAGSPEGEVIERLRTTLLAGAEPDPPMAALAALVEA